MSMRGGNGGPILAIVTAGLAVALLAAAEAPKKTVPVPPPAAAKPVAPAGPVPPKPGPEHALLARGAGTWDAAVEFKAGPPGAPPQVSKGVETSRLCCGGLWLITDFKSTPPAAPFEGHGVIGYDPVKKRYVATWIDTDLTRPMMSEGTFDAAGKVMTMKGRMERGSGETVSWTEVETWKDDGHRVFTMAMSGADGVESGAFTITYTRRK
jgi:hypothetical protein